MLQTCCFYSIYRYSSYENLSIHVFSNNKINRVNIKANYLFLLVIPNNAPKTAHKINQYASICKIHNVPKYPVSSISSSPNMLESL